MDRSTESGFEADPNLPNLESDLKTIPPGEATLPSPAIRRKYSAGTRWLVASGGLAILTIAGWLGYRTFFGQPSESVTVAVKAVERGNVEKTVSSGGTIELGGQQTLKAPKDVTVEQVSVKDGDRVRRGQPLILLRDSGVRTDLSKQRVENAKFELDVARGRAKVAEQERERAAEAAIVGREIARKREKVAEQIAAVKAAEARLQDTQALFDRGLVSKDLLSEDATKVGTAESGLKDAQLELVREQKTAQEKLGKAESELQDAQVALAKAELELRNGQEKLQDLQQQLSYQAVTAPIDGIILEVFVKNGDGVKSEGKLLTLGDPRQQVANLQLTTLDAAKVKVNQVARVSNVGPNSQVFPGRVLNVSPQASAPEGSEGGGGGNRSTARVNAQVLLDRATRIFIPGSLVSVVIQVEEKRNVIAVPAESVQQEGDDAFVWLRDRQGKAQKRPVKLGLQSPTTVEVRSGLQTGDSLILSPSAQPLKPGMDLQVEGD
ncbi:MAG: efflux RND transporter periplasmic adaptor subunit [Leptolyngbyaceae cyanobacterium bins.59]|nr:efflux RND transporter periplasmic adaptor subunit [Leptolyngbyaceae cyanobacterium bins.59]